MGIAKPIDPKFNIKEGENVNRINVGIDVGSRDNAVYIMMPDGTKHSSVSVKNNLGGAQTISKKVEPCRASTYTFIYKALPL